MNKHTPGPWVARPDPSNKITGRDDWCIGAWGIAEPDAVAVCSECDAHLIAAAPDLLSALQGLLRGIFDGPDEANAAMLVAKARDAVNKATKGK